MKIVVDTCIWSLALRRHQLSVHPAMIELQNLIEESRVQMLGVIRQELLSGISTMNQFNKLKKYLLAFPDVSVETEDFELAAEYFNTCRANGIQGSNIDYLICAIASRRQFAIFTLDKDFSQYQRIIPIALHLID